MSEESKLRIYFGIGQGLIIGGVLILCGLRINDGQWWLWAILGNIGFTAATSYFWLSAREKR